MPQHNVHTHVILSVIQRNASTKIVHLHTISRRHSRRPSSMRPTRFSNGTPAAADWVGAIEPLLNAQAGSAPVDTSIVRAFNGLDTGSHQPAQAATATAMETWITEFRGQ